MRALTLHGFARPQIWNQKHFVFHARNYGDEKLRTTIKEVALNSINKWKESSYPLLADKIGNAPILENSNTVKNLRKSKDHIFNLQKQLMDIGERKRSIMRKLCDVRSVLNNIYNGLDVEKVNRTYLEETRKEIDVLCDMEKHLLKLYYEADESEMLLGKESASGINTFVEAINKERQFLKLVCVMGVIVSSLLTIVFISYNHSKRKFLLEQEISELREQTQSESWGSYLKRNTRWMYGWATK
ncbi:uncharacterized protein LOC101892341 [Musca domestica]|uniref:Uncharacterized protein LOC101892341 n=1 Tax=Musca domestica TaxID=7370 RepID=A0A1I8M6N0_MUSDO|nr:uncharacterized protein LOC101892341 [Musca domestica]